MGSNRTVHYAWRKLVQAKVDQTAVTSPDIAYSATWATSGQNPANWPDYAQDIPMGFNAARLRFALADTDNDEAWVYIWLKDSGSHPFQIAQFKVTAGGAALGTEMVGSAALTGFRWCDTVELVAGRSGWFDIWSPGSDMIGEVRFDLAGSASICAQVDCSDDSLTDSTDVIVYWKGY